MRKFYNTFFNISVIKIFRAGLFITPNFANFEALIELYKMIFIIFIFFLLLIYNKKSINIRVQKTCFERTFLHFVKIQNGVCTTILCEYYKDCVGNQIVMLQLPINCEMLLCSCLEFTFI